MGDVYKNSDLLDNLCGTPHGGQQVNPVSVKLGKNYTLGCTGYIYSKNVNVPATINGTSYLWDAYGLRPANTLATAFRMSSNYGTESNLITINADGKIVSGSTTYNLPAYISQSVPARAIVVGLGGGGGDSGSSSGSTAGAGGGGGGYILSTISVDPDIWGRTENLWRIRIENRALYMDWLDSAGNTCNSYVYANKGNDGGDNSSSGGAGGTSGAVSLKSEYIYVMAKQSGGAGGGGGGSSYGTSGGAFSSITGTYNPEGLGITEYQPSGGNAGGSESTSSSGSGGGGSGPYGTGAKANCGGQNDGVNGTYTAGASGGSAKTWTFTNRSGATGGGAMIKFFL